MREDKQLNKHESISLGDFAFVTNGRHGYHEVKEIQTQIQQKVTESGKYEYDVIKYSYHLL